MTDAELRLAKESHAARRARRFLNEALAEEPAELRADAELIVSELVTNALLYGASPVTVRLGRTPDRVRIEVQDAGGDLPIRLHSGTDAMSGRGLSLVGALTSRWGVVARHPGKVVWAELGGGAGAAPVDPEGDLALTAGPAAEDPVDPPHTVTLGSVPTDLLLAAKSHIDNLVREFTFAQVASTLSNKQLPAELAELVQTVVHGFAAARSQIKRQAAQAAARGARETHLTLTLGLSAADAGEQYLAALDQADAHAREARILTLETPPLHRVFRHWYVEALATQLRRAAAGLDPAPVPTFPQRLAAELSADGSDTLGVSAAGRGRRRAATARTAAPTGAPASG